MYSTDHIFPVIPIKKLVNQDGEPTTPRKLEMGKKPLVSHPWYLLCARAIKKATAHSDKYSLNMCHP